MEGHRPEINRIVLTFLILVVVVVVWQCYRRGGGDGGDESTRYDEIRGEGGGERRRDELLMAQQVWPPLGNTGAREEGQSPLRKGQREGEAVCFLLILLSMCVCVRPMPAVLPTVPPTMMLPPPSLHRCSQCHGCQSKRLRANEKPFPPHANQLGQSDGKGKLCHHEMHS